MDRQLIKGNEAVVIGALLGGATHFFGYPITPASEIAEAAAQYFNGTGRCFLQAEDEVNAINMIYGAASAGARDSSDQVSRYGPRAGFGPPLMRRMAGGCPAVLFWSPAVM